MTTAIDRLLQPLVDRIADLAAQLRATPRTEWGIVTSAVPLRVRLDGDTDPLQGTPSILVQHLAVGDRVQVVIQARRVTIIGTPTDTTGRAPGAPFRMAAGTVDVPHAANTPAYAGIVVTLPAGRFTRPPIPTANLFTGTGGAQKDVARAYGSTTSSITLGVWTGDMVGTSVAHVDTISWTAVQMAEGSAAG